MPGFTRKGVFTTLIGARAHQYFREMGYRFSFLGTRALAHRLYEKLGYKDVVEYPSGYKVLRRRPRNARVEGLVSAFEPQKMLEIYNKATKGARAMCKPLTGDVSFSQTYGDRFFLTRLDSF